jgi:transposase-like protein
MGRKLKYSQAQKVQACIDYVSGKKSAKQIAQELKMGKRGDARIYKWIKSYSVHGASCFEEKKNNQSYSKEFKEKVVKEYLNGDSSLDDLTAKYNLPSVSILCSWIKKYNSHIELKDYDPKPEIYMAEKLKTTLEERIEIVKYCLEHNRDIKGTAAHHGCKYAQLYQWVTKYEKFGEEGLIDKRGKRKNEEELSELEKAKRRIAQLERQNKELKDSYEILKKAEARERW